MGKGKKKRGKHVMITKLSQVMPIHPIPWTLIKVSVFINPYLANLLYNAFKADPLGKWC